MLAEGPAEEEVDGWAGAVPGVSVQRGAGPHSAGDGGPVTGVGGRDSGHVGCATCG